MERLKRMSVFAKVVELGSFTAAARQLQMSVSSISQTVSKLEDELQVKLLNRSTRSIGLTEAGKIYYQGCRRECCTKRRMFTSSFMPLTTRPSARLRIGCSSTMAQNVLAGLTATMLKEYPGSDGKSGNRHPGPGFNCRWSGRGYPRRCVAGLQSVLASPGCHADGSLRG